VNFWTLQCIVKLLRFVGKIHKHKLRLSDGDEMGPYDRDDDTKSDSENMRGWGSDGKDETKL